jgi:hypothetical protein
MSNSVAGAFFLAVVVLLCGIGWYFSRQAGSAPSGPASPVPSEQAAAIPTGWVKITNRTTGRAIGFRGQGAKRIEPAGDYYKIRRQEDGQFLALEDWALKGPVPNKPGLLLRAARDAEDRSMFWKFEPLGDGYWRIVNRETGQCLVPRGPNDYHVAQAPARDDALEQQWRLEPLSP